MKLAVIVCYRVCLMFLFPEHHGVTEHKRSGADGELPDHLARHVFIVDFEDIIVTMYIVL